MKFTKLFFLLVLFFISGSKCISGDTYLQLSLFNDADFTVVLDDISLNEPGNIAEFENLAAGEHFLRVVKSGANVPSKDDVLFEGKIKIPSGFNVYAVIDEYNAFSIYKKVPVEKGRCRVNCDYYRYCGGTGHNVHHEEHHENIVSDECKYKIINENDYREFKKSIGSRNFEGTNVDITKEMLDKNTVSSEQVREILGFFTFESDKLENAKYAYKHTCDQKNYTKVNDAFTFDASVQELRNYISGK